MTVGREPLDIGQSISPLETAGRNAPYSQQLRGLRALCYLDPGTGGQRRRSSHGPAARPSLNAVNASDGRATAYQSPSHR